MAWRKNEQGQWVFDLGPAPTGNVVAKITAAPVKTIPIAPGRGPNVIANLGVGRMQPNAPVRTGPPAWAQPSYGLNQQGPQANVLGPTISGINRNFFTELFPDLLPPGFDPTPKSDPGEEYKRLQNNLKAIGGLSGKADKDAERLRKLIKSGQHNIGQLIREKFVDTPEIPDFNSEKQKFAQAKQQGVITAEEEAKLTQDLARRANEWYSAYAGKFVERLTGDTTRDIDVVKAGIMAKPGERARPDQVSAPDPEVANYIRRANLARTESDLTEELNKQKERTLEEKGKNPLGLPGFLTKNLPGGIRLADLVPGMNIAETAARVKSQETHQGAATEMSAQRAYFAEQEATARKNGDAKAADYFRRQANQLNETLQEQQQLANVFDSPALTRGRIAGDTLMAMLQFGTIGAGAKALAALPGAAKNTGAAFLQAPGRTALSLGKQGAAAAAIGSGGGAALGAGYAGLTGDPIGESAKQGAKLGLLFSPLGVRGVKPRTQKNINLLDGITTRGIRNNDASPVASAQNISQTLTGRPRQVADIDLLKGRTEPKGVLPERTPGTFFRGGSEMGSVEGQGGVYLTSNSEGARTFGKNIHEFSVNVPKNKILDVRSFGGQMELERILKDGLGVDPDLGYFSSIPHKFASVELKRAFVEYVKENTPYKAVHFDDVDFSLRKPIDSLVVFDPKDIKKIRSSGPPREGLSTKLADTSLQQQQQAFGPKTNPVSDLISGRGTEMRPSSPRRTTPQSNLLGTVPEDMAAVRAARVERQRQFAQERNFRNSVRESYKGVVPSSDRLPAFAGDEVNLTAKSGQARKQMVGTFSEDITVPEMRAQIEKALDDIDFDKVKDKRATFQDPNRAREHAFGEFSDVVKFMEEAQDNVNLAATEQSNAVTAAVRSKLADLGIRPKHWWNRGDDTIQILYQYRTKTGQFKDRQAIVDRFGEARAKQFDEANAYLEDLFKTHHDMMATRNKALGLKPVPFRENYWPEPREGHFGKLSTDQGVGGFVDSPEGPVGFFRRGKEGQGGQKNPALGLERFIDSYYRDYYKSEQAVRASEFAKALSERMGKDSSSLVRVFENLSRENFGLPVGLGSQELTGKWGQRYIAAQNIALRQNSRASIGGSLTSLIPQASQAVARAFESPATFLRAAMDTARGRGVDPMKVSRVFRERYLENQQLYKTAGRRVDNALYFGIRHAEKGPNTIAWKSFYHEATSKNLSGDAAIRYADREFKRLIGSRQTGDQGTVLTSPVGRPFTQFQNEVQNAFLRIVEAARNNPKRLAATLVAYWAYNTASEAVSGRRPLFDPIQASIDASQKDNPKDAIGRLLGEVGSNFAGGQTLSVGALNLAGVKEEDRKRFFGQTEVGRFGALPPALGLLEGFRVGKEEGIQNLIAGVTPAGRQIKRSAEGLGTVLSGEYRTQGDNTRLFGVAKTPGNILRGVTMGRSSLPEAQAYFEQVEQGGFPASEEALMQLRNVFSNLNNAEGISALKGISPSDKAIEQLAKFAKSEKVGDRTEVYFEGNREQMFAKIDEKLKNDPKAAREAKAAYDMLSVLQEGIFPEATKFKKIQEQKDANQITGPKAYSDMSKLHDQIVDRKITGTGSVSQDAFSDFQALPDGPGPNSKIDYLNNVASPEEAAALYAQWVKWVQEGGSETQTGGPRSNLSSDPERWDQNLKITKSQINRGFSEDTVDLQSMNSFQRQLMVGANPGAYQNDLLAALNLIAQRGGAQIISPSSQKSQTKAINKLLSGNFGSGSSGGGGRKKKGGGKKKGRKGKVPGKARIPKGRTRKAKTVKSTSGGLESLFPGLF